MFLEKRLSYPTFCTTDPACTGLGLHPGLRGERLATNPLSYGTAHQKYCCGTLFCVS